jgi:hypothetical protein
MSNPTPLSPDALQAIQHPPPHIVELAVEVSEWSPCRSKRGVVIFDGENVVAHGHNQKSECDGSEACKAVCSRDAVHAEQMALLAAYRSVRGSDMLHVKTVCGRLVPSGGPSCVQCSKLARWAGIAGFWLFHESGWRRYEIGEFHRLSLAAPDPLLAERQARAQAERERDAFKQEANDLRRNYLRETKELAARADAAEAQLAKAREALDAVPTNWCDELLTGPNGIGQPPYTCPDIERLLRGVRARVTAALASASKGEKA